MSLTVQQSYQQLQQLILQTQSHLRESIPSANEQAAELTTAMPHTAMLSTAISQMQQLQRQAVALGSGERKVRERGNAEVQKCDVEELSLSSEVSHDGSSGNNPALGEQNSPVQSDTLQPIQTEISKQLRLLETDLVFLRAARQATTLEQRQQQIQQRFEMLLNYCDLILDQIQS